MEPKVATSSDTPFFTSPFNRALQVFVAVLRFFKRAAKTPDAAHIDLIHHSHVQATRSSMMPADDTIKDSSKLNCMQGNLSLDGKSTFSTFSDS